MPHTVLRVGPAHHHRHRVPARSIPQLAALDKVVDRAVNLFTEIIRSVFVHSPIDICVVVFFLSRDSTIDPEAVRLKLMGDHYRHMICRVCHGSFPIHHFGRATNERDSGRRNKEEMRKDCAYRRIERRMPDYHHAGRPSWSLERRPCVNFFSILLIFFSSTFFDRQKTGVDGEHT